MAEGDVPPPAPAPEPEVETAGKEKGKAKGRGLLRRMWDVIFHGRGDDFEKRLQYLSKEEAAAHARMKRRAQGWRKTARNVVVCSVVAEVFAVVYAIITTRTEELTLQMRSLRVFPMFLLPGVSYVIYSALHSFTRMRDRKDQKTLERLRAERQAKIDELKERTNYYTTQQLIQKYDLDPAAKAAAASVLASKLGAESGLRVSVDVLNNEASGRSSAVEVPPTEGLRNRKHPGRRSTDSMSSAAHYSPPPEGTYTAGLDGQTSTPVPAEQFVEHYKGSGGNSEGGWIARLAAMLVGEDPSQSYALICGNCRMHNGLARKEDFPYITYYCPHCHALNGHRHADRQGPASSPASRSSRSPASESVVATPKGSSSSVTLATSHPATDASPAISEADATEHPAVIASPAISETDATDHPDINASPPIPKADPAIDASAGGDTPDTAAAS